MALTRTELDRMQCMTPDCDEPHGALYFHGRCHPESPTWAWYENGVVTVECAKCEAVIAAVTVAA